LESRLPRADQLDIDHPLEFPDPSGDALEEGGMMLAKQPLEAAPKTSREDPFGQKELRVGWAPPVVAVGR